MALNKETAAAILLVEHDPEHALLIKKYLLGGGTTHDFVVLDDGRKAVDYLFKQGAYAADARPAPPFIILDLNLPVLSGREALELIKNDERTKKIPVVVLTATDNPREIARCYELGCNLYVAKPIEYDQFSETIRRLCLFLSIVKTPEGE